MAVLALLCGLDSVQIWHIYVLMFIRALGGAFHWPAMQASTSLMVPEKYLSRVAGLNQALQGLAAIVALALGGFGFALVGLAPAHAFLLAVGAMFLAGFMMVIVNGSVFAI